jgi:hypothetical protein
MINIFCLIPTDPSLHGILGMLIYFAVVVVFPLNLACHVIRKLTAKYLEDCGYFFVACFILEKQILFLL